jgi:hypothetical protein
VDYLKIFGSVTQQIYNKSGGKCTLTGRVLDYDVCKVALKVQAGHSFEKSTNLQELNLVTFKETVTFIVTAVIISTLTH